ncbi:MAG: ArsR/SmtB family transcription factor [Dehalococcoidia bacterium]
MASSATAKAPVFAALGDETRLRIVSRLGESPRLSISALSAGEAVTRQAITKHLHVLEGAGLVESTRQGREQLWELKAERVEEARNWLDEISRRWDERLERLRAFVEE